MAFERKFKGATEFLQASRRAGSTHSGQGDSEPSGLDNRVLEAIMRVHGDHQRIADAAQAHPGEVEGAVTRLMEEGFIKRSNGQAYQATEAGQRYFKYSRLSKY